MLLCTEVTKLANMILCESWLQEAACKPRTANTAGKLHSAVQLLSDHFLTASVLDGLWAISVILVSGYKTMIKEGHLEASHETNPNASK